MTWEFLRYDWQSLRAMSDASGVPASLEALKSAPDAATAERAYWRIDNCVVVQGSLYEAALPTMRCACSLLAQCTPASRVCILELMVQLGAGETDPSEVAIGNESLADDCKRELLYVVDILYQILESGSDEERVHSVDLLGLCCDVDRLLKPRTEFYFQKVLETGGPAHLLRHVGDWLNEL